MIDPDVWSAQFVRPDGSTIGTFVNWSNHPEALWSGNPYISSDYPHAVRERMERELRTTIPATIQKARELGDLKENAEYHSAKLKQANVSKQVASLQLRLARARFVEEAELKDGVVGLGTEVVLESERDLTTYWILGEGEHHHGDHVISFQTPVARALMGKAIGDEVELEVDSERQRYRVVSIERRLPPHEAGSETTAPA